MVLGGEEFLNIRLICIKGYAKGCAAERDCWHFFKIAVFV